MAGDCGHLCCQIPDNAYHAHTSPPDRCPSCGPTDPTEASELDEIVRIVVTRIAPEIPGLPEGPELVSVARAHAIVALREAREDPLTRDVGDHVRALAGRVGLALAFGWPATRGW